MKLDGKVAIITGGARGIGLAIAKRYVAEGAKVVIADVDAAAGDAAARALGEACRFKATDVGDAQQAQSLINDAVAAFGALDILVNNAGIVHAADFLDLKEADFDRVLRVNLKGAFLVGQAAARRMTPLGRIGEPDEVAAIALFLASDDAAYITGQTVYADGGRLGLNYTVAVKDDSLG